MTNVSDFRVIPCPKYLEMLPNGLASQMISAEEVLHTPF